MLSALTILLSGALQPTPHTIRMDARALGLGAKPALKQLPLPLKLGFGLFLFQSSVARADRPLADEILAAAQKALRADPRVTMELGMGVEAGGVFASACGGVPARQQLNLCFQVNGGNIWAECEACGLKAGDEPVELLDLSVSNMDAVMGGKPSLVIKGREAEAPTRAAPPPSMSLARSRRQLLRRMAPAGALAMAPGCLARPPPPVVTDELRLLVVKAKALRGYVGQISENRRSFPMDPDPAVNNYGNIKATVVRAQGEVLLPLQRALERAAAASEAGGALPAVQQQSLALQPQLLRGHLLELELALAAGQPGFERYTSKSSGREYRGGKVERELEEVGETCDDFLAIAAPAGRPPPPTSD